MLLEEEEGVAAADNVDVAVEGSFGEMLDVHPGHFFLLWPVAAVVGAVLAVVRVGEAVVTGFSSCSGSDSATIPGCSPFG